MSVKNTIVNFSYGVGDNLIQIPPLPIIARRDPSPTDIAQLGTLWINNPTDTAWLLTSVVAGVASWTPAPVAGATVVASLQVTGAGGIDVDIGDVDINLGDLILGAGSATIAGDLTVAGTTTINGDFDLTSAALIDLTSTLNAAPSILLHANGGAAESIELHSDQGTSVTSVNIHSDVGGLTLASGLASADAINLTASSGGVDIDGALQVNIASSQNAADAIVLSASAGGIDILATGAATEDIDIVNTGGSVNITATENVAQAIYIRANGGTSETVQIHADQGTGVASLNLLSDVGGITLSAGLATADAINITTSNAAGGIDVDAGTAGFIVDTTGAFSLDGAAASNASVSGAGIDLSLVSAAGRVVVNGEEAAADAITLLSAAGGLDANVALQMNLDSSQAAADAIRVLASNAAGGIDIDAGTGGIAIDSTGVVSIQGAVASDITVTGAGVDLTLSSTGGRVVVDGGEAAADAVRLVASNAAGGIDADAGTGGIAFDSTGAVSLQGAAASDFSVSGAGIDLSLVSAAGRVIMNGEEAAADALTLLSAAGGLDVNVALQMNLDSSQAAANAIRILASNAAGGIDVDSGTAGIALDSTGAVSLQGGAASDFSVTGAGIDLSLVSAAGRVIVNGEEAASDAITLLSAAGGIDVDAALQINIASSQNAANAIVITSSVGGIDITAPGAAAGEDIDIIATGSSVNLTSTEAVADAIVLNASNAAGGIDLLTGGGEITISSAGNVTMTPGTASVAGTSLTLNARVGVATFTGLTTAAAATETLTITNSALGAGDGIFCTVSNRGTNDAQMTLTRVNTQTAGTLIVQCDNNGAAALNGDLIVTFWIIN